MAGQKPTCSPKPWLVSLSKLSALSTLQMLSSSLPMVVGHTMPHPCNGMQGYLHCSLVSCQVFQERAASGNSAAPIAACSMPFRGAVHRQLLESDSQRDRGRTTLHRNPLPKPLKLCSRDWLPPVSCTRLPALAKTWPYMPTACMAGTGRGKRSCANRVNSRSPPIRSLVIRSLPSCSMPCVWCCPDISMYSLHQRVRELTSASGMSVLP